MAQRSSKTEKWNERDQGWRGEQKAGSRMGSPAVLVAYQLELHKCVLYPQPLSKLNKGPFLCGLILSLGGG